MRQLNILCLMLLVAAFALVGCRQGAPISNPQVSVNQAKTLTQDEVRAAILTACPRTDWVPKEIAPGKIEATLNIRAHSATVTIVYSATSYQIKYKTSHNLRASGGEIHPYYNGWIQNLRENIDIELAATAARKK